MHRPAEEGEEGAAEGAEEGRAEAGGGFGYSSSTSASRRGRRAQRGHSGIRTGHPFSGCGGGGSIWSGPPGSGARAGVSWGHSSRGSGAGGAGWAGSSRGGRRGSRKGTLSSSSNCWGGKGHRGGACSSTGSIRSSHSRGTRSRRGLHYPPTGRPCPGPTTGAPTHSTTIHIITRCQPRAADPS